MVGYPEEFPKKKMDRLEKDMVELCKTYSYTYFGTETVDFKGSEFAKKNNVFIFVTILLIKFVFLLKLKLNLSSLILLKQIK